MRLYALFLLGGLLSAPLANAETARVRSGDHPGFSRLVIELDQRSDWRFGRVEGGYALEYERSDVTFDTSDVYRLITRARIADVSENRETGRLVLSIECDCHAIAAEHRNSWVIIDVANGPAPSDSPFEARLDGQGTQASRRAEPPPSANRQVVDRGANFVRPPPTPDLPEPAPLPDWTETALQPAADRRTNSEQAAPSADAQVLPLGEPEIPDMDQRIKEQEALLLEELARAASQGLLEADLDVIERPVEEPTESPELVDPAPDNQVPVAGPATEDHVRIQVETSIDRDTGEARTAQRVTSEGHSCLPDRYFDLQAFGGDAEDPVLGLAEHRADLVGEFDRPDSQAVLDLARYYLFLGFGAEAKATLSAFDDLSPEAEVVTALAAILDGANDVPVDILADQAECDGRVALWAALADTGGGVPSGSNVRAILAAFSELPIHLRRHLGPPLAERFLIVGDNETALALRNAIARAPGEHGAAFELLDAQIDLAEGKPDAIAGLEDLVDSDETVAARAYSTFLEAELDDGRVPDNAVDTAGALAFEFSGTETGNELARLSIRSLLASGDFDAARVEIARLEREGGALPTPLWSEFAEALTNGAQDAEFVRQAFNVRASLAGNTLSREEAVALGRRLISLGFAEESLRYLPSSAGDAPTRLARAGALLATNAPAEALGTLSGLESQEAELLRARALLGLGDPRGAAERFLLADDQDSAMRAAWIAGAWDVVSQIDDASRQRIAQRLVDDNNQPDMRSGDVSASAVPAAGPDNSAVPQDGAVTRARASLEDARDAKAAIEAILSGASEDR